MATGGAHSTFLRRPLARATGAGLLIAAAAVTVLDTGCALYHAAVAPPIAECEMRIRLVGDPTMAPVRVFTGRLLMDPFGFQVTGCGTPSSVSARDTWERLAQQALDEVCAPGSTASLEERMRWCAGGAWCKVPGSSTCADHTMVSDSRCTPTPSTSPIPDCAVMPPPPGPRIQVMPNPVTFAGETAIGTMRGRLVTVTNAGGGMLTVGMARVVTTDPMSMGSFLLPTATCGSAPPLAGADTCTINVRFRAQSPPGVKQGMLEIPYNDGMDRVESVPVSGTAAAATLDASGCTTDPASAGAPRRLCFGSSLQRSFTLATTGGPVPVHLALPAGYTLVAPASSAFTVTPGTPVTVTVGGAAVPVTAGLLVINRDDGGTPIQLELTSACLVPAGCG